MLRGLIEAIGALTVLPVKSHRAMDAHDRACFLVAFPVVGLLFGVPAALLVRSSFYYLPIFAAWLIPLYWLLLSGATHFLGLCKTLNGMLRTGTRDARLEVLSSEGMAAPGLVCAFMLFSGKSLVLMSSDTIGEVSLMTAVLLAPVYSRFVAVLFALSSENVAGRGKRAILNHWAFVMSWTVILVALITVVVGFLLGSWIVTFLMSICALLTAFFFQDLAARRFGRIPPPVLGALVELTEVLMLWTVALTRAGGLDQ